MRIKAAIVLPSFSSGGAQVMVSRLASHLDLNEVDAEVICIYGKPLGSRLEKAIADRGIPIRYIGKGKGFSAKAMIRLFRELDRFGPDLVHTHLSACVYCAPWVLARAKTLLHTVHNIPEKELIKSKQLVMRALYKRKAAVPVAISHEIRALVEAYYHPGAGTELVYNPVDIQSFAGVKKKERANTGTTGSAEEKEHTVAITAGRLSEQKNHKLLIEAFVRYHERSPEDTLILLGDGPCRSDLEEQIRASGAESYISMPGNVENIAEYFGMADVFVMSSDYEGLPLVVLEAMAASLPIISTDVGGVRDLVTDNGILVEKGNGDQLCDALLSLMHDEAEREKMGEKSFEHVQRFDSKIIAREYMDLYRKYAS